MSRPLSIALGLGTFPIVLGLGVYFLWRALRAEWIETTVMFLLLLCAGALMAAVLFLAQHVRYVYREKRVLQSSDMWVIGLVGFLLLANIPVAGWLTISAISIANSYTIQVVNSSGLTVEEFELRGPGITLPCGPIEPDTSILRYLGFKGEGDLVLVGRQGTNQLNEVLEKSVQDGFRGAVQIVIQPGNQIELQRPEPPKPPTPPSAP